jgi:hypothetical protein
VFIVAAAMDLVAAFMAIGVLLHMRRRGEPQVIPYTSSVRWLRITGAALLAASVVWWLAFLNPLAGAARIACLAYTTPACEATLAASGVSEFLVYRPFLTWIAVLLFVAAWLVAILRPKTTAAVQPA